jgi:hypothetical protein
MLTVSAIIINASYYSLILPLILSSSCSMVLISSFLSLIYTFNLFVSSLSYLLIWIALTVYDKILFIYLVNVSIFS